MTYKHVSGPRARQSKPIDQADSHLLVLRRWLAVPAICLVLVLSACGSGASASPPAPRPTATTTPDPHVAQARSDTENWLNQYQQEIFTAQVYGQDVTEEQQELTQDEQDFTSAQTAETYQALSARIQTQMQALQHTMLSNKTRFDLGQLQGLIGQTDITNDYEYRDADDAYLQEQDRFEQAQTQQDYQAIDDQVQILLNNLHALLTNLNDATPHDQPHATDLQLMRQYNLMSGKVLVVSLTEQTLRVYQDGQLVKVILVTTGQRAAQSPPGLWHIFSKGTNLTFTSHEPIGSALYYPPTPIHYGMAYHANGYFFHDATWRAYFGPGTNLPHPDYKSGQYSDTGTHGCVNMSLDDTAWLYQFVEIGTPALLY